MKKLSALILVGLAGLSSVCLAASDNPLMGTSYNELRAVYANRGGQQCIRYSEALQTSSKANEQDELGCKAFQKLTPYSLAQITDPEAISRFQEETLKTTCEQQEKRVDGRFIKRTSACEQYFAALQ